MPSPFSGMDPFLESQEWEDFHTRFIPVISDMLSPRVEPRYIVRIERRVYVERPVPDDPPFVRADVAVMRGGEERAGTAVMAGPPAILQPLEYELPMPEERREAYLVIRLRENMEVVTVLEVLSPANKRRGGDGRREYLAKRDAVLRSEAHLVELDLLRGGLRLPTMAPLPRADYFAFVSRRQRRPKAAVYAWTLRDRLPTIPVPLKYGDADVPLDLQAAFDTVYDRARYQLSLNYDADLQPPPPAEDAAWTAQIIQASRQQRSN